MATTAFTISETWTLVAAGACSIEQAKTIDPAGILVPANTNNQVPYILLSTGAAAPDADTYDYQTFMEHFVYAGDQPVWLRTQAGTRVVKVTDEVAGGGAGKDLSGSDIENDSTVDGATLTDALDWLKENGSAGLPTLVVNPIVKATGMTPIIPADRSSYCKGNIFSYGVQSNISDLTGYYISMGSGQSFVLEDRQSKLRVDVALQDNGQLHIRRTAADGSQLNQGEPNVARLAVFWDAGRLYYDRIVGGVLARRSIIDWPNPTDVLYTCGAANTIPAYHTHTPAAASFDLAGRTAWGRPEYPCVAYLTSVPDASLLNSYVLLVAPTWDTTYPGQPCSITYDGQFYEAPVIAYVKGDTAESANLVMGSPSRPEYGVDVMRHAEYSWEPPGLGYLVSNLAYPSVRMLTAQYIHLEDIVPAAGLLLALSTSIIPEFVDPPVGMKRTLSMWWWVINEHHGVRSLKAGGKIYDLQPKEVGLLQYRPYSPGAGQYKSVWVFTPIGQEPPTPTVEDIYFSSSGQVRPDWWFGLRAALDSLNRAYGYTSTGAIDYLPNIPGLARVPRASVPKTEVKMRKADPAYEQMGNHVIYGPAEIVPVDIGVRLWGGVTSIDVPEGKAVWLRWIPERANSDLPAWCPLWLNTVDNIPEPPLVPVPATPTSPGIPGQQAADSDYLYTCYATDQWQRVAKDATWI